MLEISVPGYKGLRLEHLVLDYNGTLACDGEILPGVKEALDGLAQSLRIHVVTADTFGKAASRLEGCRCELVVLPLENQDAGKLEYIKRLGPESTVCVGNGRNDRMMLEGAGLGIAVIQEEGAAVQTLLAADVACPDILSALNLLTNPLRLVATLRS